MRDAQAWEAVLRELRLEVTTLLDSNATRQRVLDALAALVTSARPGEAVVFQYSGHGTQAADLNGDESDRYDEALVPIDYQSGALLLDDDLADIYRQLPDGAVLTLFMDCCPARTAGLRRSTAAPPAARSAAASCSSPRNWRRRIVSFARASARRSRRQPRNRCRVWFTSRHASTISSPTSRAVRVTSLGS